MNTLDNIITSKEAVMIDTKLVPVVNPMNGVEAGCIVCNCTFWTYPQTSDSNQWNPVQTLLCPECLEHLKNTIKREKEQDYGW